LKVDVGEPKGIADKTNQIFIGPMIETHLDFVESHLAKNTWFLGDDLSAADMILPE
jgi:glutathione S-transferase